MANLSDLEAGRPCPNEVTAHQANFAREWSEEEIEMSALAEQLEKWVPD